MYKGFLTSIFAVLWAASSAFSQGEQNAFDENPPPTPNAFSEMQGDLFDPWAPNMSWLSGEYVLLGMSDANLPPIATTSIPTGDLAQNLGILGNPNTRILLGEQIDDQVYHGMHIHGGFWFNPEHTLGIEAAFLLLPGDTERFAARSANNGIPIISRPVIDARNGMETAFGVAFPDQFVGLLDISYYTRLFGIEGNVLLDFYNPPITDFGNILFFGGVRYLDLHEELNVRSTTQLTGGGIAAFNGMPLASPAQLHVFDRFQTYNKFTGGQIGIRHNYANTYFFCESSLKVAVGVNQVRRDIAGSTVLLGQGAPTPAVGGLLALPTNMGRAESDIFSVVPELNLKLGIQITKNFSIAAGYKFLYWFNVIRPGDQIDRTVNPNQLPSSIAFTGAADPARPAANFDRVNMWLQGLVIEFGLKY